MFSFFFFCSKVCAFNDPEAALVQFSHHSEAKAAHSCPDAVLGNRFIRVFWHNPDRPQNNKVSIAKYQTKEIRTVHKLPFLAMFRTGLQSGSFESIFFVDVMVSIIHFSKALFPLFKSNYVMLLVDRYVKKDH